ncbi:MAG: ATP-binding cassette domain-containing protein [Eggerthellaceae bacterium]|nr:ATP-binding cassette domain-containing protein [Eggerthellaceae bacterium]
MALLAFEDVTFRYPEAARTALDGVSLEVEAGEYLCLCGPSGCGKTTLLRQMKTALQPAGERSGRVLLDGRPLDHVPAREQAARIGFVMQNPDAQIVTDRVWSELAFGLENLGWEPSAMRLRVAEMASYFGLENWFERDVAELSGGQKQLLNLAAVMAMAPDVLVLDEPTAQLDPIAATTFLETVKRLNRDLGTTVVMVEHRLEEVFAVADRVAVLEEGRVVTHGTPQEVAVALYAANSPLTCALPTPTRVFCEVKGPTVPAPLTIQEGRTWLKNVIATEARTFPSSSRPEPEGRSGEIFPNSENASGVAKISRLRALRFARDDEQGSPQLAVAIKNLWFRYGRTAPDVLRGVDLAVPERGIFALSGGNGAGKSTLLRCICGVAGPHRGKVVLFGDAGSRKHALDQGKRVVALLPQEPLNLFAFDTVRADLEEMLPHASVQERAVAVQAVAERCGVAGLLNRHPYDLSGGELQRAALAKVLLAHPRLLLLDEPTKGLDALAKREFAALLRQLTAEGVTVLLVSHDVEFCARTADQAALLFNGEVVASAPVREFFARNAFYTTAASRMSRGIIDDAITAGDIVAACVAAEPEV